MARRKKVKVTNVPVYAYRDAYCEVPNWPKDAEARQEAVAQALREGTCELGPGDMADSDIDFAVIDRGWEFVIEDDDD